MEKIDISKELLEYLYVRKGYSRAFIGEELGVSRETVSNKLKLYSIERTDNAKSTDNTKYPYRDKDTFVETYNKLRSFKKMAKEFGCEYGTILKWKAIHNVKSAYSLTDDELQRRKLVADAFSKENLFRMYITEHLSTVEIAEELRCNPTTVCNYLHSYNIPIRNVTEQWKVKEKAVNVLQRSGETDFQFLLRCRSLGMGSESHSKPFKRIKQIVSKCQVCGFNEDVRVLDVHHIDKNKENNKIENFIVLCPNCHAKVHRVGLDLSKVSYTPWYVLVEECAKETGEFYSYFDAK